jgi:hypothetical protein
MGLQMCTRPHVRVSSFVPWKSCPEAVPEELPVADRSANTVELLGGETASQLLS